MIEQKDRVHVCLLYGFDQGEGGGGNAAECHRILSEVFDDEVPLVRQ